LFPGEYIVSLFIKSGNFTAEDRVKVKVINPAIEISDVKVSGKDNAGFIKIKNNSSEVLNLSS
jgi:hypothetical protein